MTILNKNKSKKVNLLEMPECERIKMIRQVKLQLRQKAVEAKLWHFFVEAEDLTINQHKIDWKNMQMNGLSLSDLFEKG